jgi:hypothetical protein
MGQASPVPSGLSHAAPEPAASRLGESHASYVPQTGLTRRPLNTILRVTSRHPEIGAVSTIMQLWSLLLCWGSLLCLAMACMMQPALSHPVTNHFTRSHKSDDTPYAMLTSP